MLKISDKEPFAVGHYRASYTHPENPGKCLKVLLKGRSSKELRKSAPFYKRLRPEYHFNENLDELRQNLKTRKQLDSSIKIIPKTYGTVETDLGNALCIELIRDANGDISLTAGKFVQTYGFTKSVHIALEAMLNCMIQYNIQLKDPGMNNILLQRKEDDCLNAVIIDGLGSPTFLPLDKIFAKKTRKRIHAKVSKIKQRLQQIDIPSKDE